MQEYISTLLDPIYLNSLAKIIKRNEQCVVRVFCADKLSYDLSYSKDDRFWCIDRFLNDELQDTMMRRKLRQWLNNLEDIHKLELVHKAYKVLN